MWAKTKRAPGFTVVELLIVVVVIAVLAAIVVVAYNGLQQRARASEASASLSQAKQKLEIYKVDNGVYPTTGNLANAGIVDSDVTYQYTSNDGSTFCITGTAANVSYKATDTTSPVSGGCSGHGQGGVAPITNMATNPSLEGSTTGWTLQWYGGGGSGSAARTSTAAHCGTYGYRKTWTVSGGGQSIGWSYRGAAQAGKTYTASVALRASYDTTEATRFTWYDSSGTAIGGEVGWVRQSASANSWVTISTTYTAPAGAASMGVIYGPYPQSNPGLTVPVGATVDGDCLMIAEGSTNYNFADGGSTNWAWNGTVNESTSTGPAS